METPEPLTPQQLKSREYTHSLFQVFLTFKYMAFNNNDNKMKMMAVILYKYIRAVAHLCSIDLREYENMPSEKVELMPIFEYIRNNNIQLLTKEQLNDPNLKFNENSPVDFERFVLSNIYYITQSLSI